MSPLVYPALMLIAKNIRIIQLLPDFGNAEIRGESFDYRFRDSQLACLHEALKAISGWISWESLILQTRRKGLFSSRHIVQVS